MNDLLLKELGKLARRQEEAERARLDERWERLAAGTLTAEEETKLRALATSSPEAGEAYVAFKPLGAEFQARVVNAINAEWEGEAPRTESREERPRVVSLPSPPDEIPDAQARDTLKGDVLPFSPVVRRFVVWVGAAAAVAAGLFFLVPLVRGPSYDPLPSYQIAQLEGRKTMRGNEPSLPNEVPVFTPGMVLTIPASPQTPVTGPVKPLAFFSTSTGSENLVPWKVKSTNFRTEEGSVLIEGTLGQDIHLSPGAWIVWTVVARPSSIPKVDEVQARLRAKRPRNESWHAVCAALKMEEKPPPAQWQVACTEDFRVEGQPAP